MPKKDDKAKNNPRPQPSLQLKTAYEIPSTVSESAALEAAQQVAHENESAPLEFVDVAVINGIAFEKGANGLLYFVACERKNEQGEQTCPHPSEYIVLRHDGQEELTCEQHVGPAYSHNGYQRLNPVRRFA